MGTSGRHKQKETQLQKRIVEFLNGMSGLGCIVSRIKNTATWNPTIHRFQASTTELGIADIIGCDKNGRAIFIEVKMLKPNGRANKVPDHQKAWLIERDKRNALVGIAYSISDAYDIIADDPVNYPRLPRTFGHKGDMSSDKPERQKKKKQDPLEAILSLSGSGVLEVHDGGGEEQDEC